MNLDITLTSPGATETATFKGIGTNNAITFESDGQDVIGHIVHIGFHEEALLDINPAYPIRNADGKVQMDKHRVSFIDHRGVLRNYIVKNWYPDETVGMIMCDCNEYEP
jgi:hypothetical protein